MRGILVLAAAAILAGCAHVTPVTTKTLRTSATSYVLGEEETRYTGEPMVYEEDLVFYKAPVATADFQPPGQLGSTYPVIRTGMEFIPYGQLGNGDVLYRAEGLRPGKTTGGSVSWDYCIAVDMNGEAYGDAACALGIVRRWEPRPENFLEMKVVYREGTTRKELLYSGKTGNTIKMAYREFRGSLAAQAFYQELSYDLSESMTVRFRGMVIDVAEATNSSIRFTVRSRMDGKGQGSPAGKKEATRPAVGIQANRAAEL